MASKKHRKKILAFHNASKKNGTKKDREKIIEIELLIKGYNGDIQFGMHSLSAEMSRSESRRELVQIGKETLKPIALHLRKGFSSGYKLVDESLHSAWISLLFDIISTNNLPKEPYARNIKYLDQNINEWIKYCELNG